MKKLALVFLFGFLAACNKSPEGQAYLIISAMTDGQWKITSFKKGGMDASSGFNPYAFQFKTDLSVDALNNGTLEKTGSWSADTEAKTITSNFTNVSEPLSLLNGTWNITKTTWTSVDATMTVGGEVRIMHMEKL